MQRQGCDSKGIKAAWLGWEIERGPERQRGWTWQVGGTGDRLEVLGDL